jgi:tRNA(Ile)-lysidine synthase
MRLRRLEPVLRRALHGPCRVPPGARVLIALSGGADSTALLLGLSSVAPEFGVELCAAHLHHGLRGAEADGDLAFARNLCARLGVPFAAARVDARRRMRARGLAGENGLRVLRREFLARAAGRLGAAFVATAHTADDQLETLLLRLGRGAGLPGLAGMRPRAGRWLKPLLAATRRDVESDLRRIGQAWREDGTNRAGTAARNRLRLDAIPALARALAPDATVAAVRDRLARSAARAAAEALAAQRALAAIGRRRAPARGAAGGGVAVACPALVRLSAAARLAAIRGAFRRVAPAGTGLSTRHLDALERLALSARARGPVALPGGRVAAREGDLLRFGVRGIEQLSGGPPGSGVVPLPVPGTTAFGDLRLRGGWTRGETARKRLGEKGASEEYFAAGGIRGALEVRQARPDEMFVPFGRRRSVRIREFLRRHPVREHRRHPTVLADAGGILWVVGVRRSARAPVSPATRRVLRVHVERHDREPGRSN